MELTNVRKGGEITPSRVKNKATGLTESQEAFCRQIAFDANATITECYLGAYPNFEGTRKTAAECASRLWAKPSVKERVANLRNAFVAKCPLPKGEALGILADIARDNTEASRLRIDAIRQMQTMLPEWQADTSVEAPSQIAVTIVANPQQANELARRARGELTDRNGDGSGINNHGDSHHGGHNAHDGNGADSVVIDVANSHDDAE